jgi:acetyl-CoA carboxylase biotin carboxyl carrier protein
MDIKDLRTLVKLVTETDITEFEMENSEEKILIKRGTSREIVHVAAPAAYAAPVPGPVGATAALPAGGPSPAPAAGASAGMAGRDKYETVTSPIVGTFYRAPSPESDPYVQVGSVVDKGGIFCIIEAMKLMNEIEVEFKCKIVEICKENAQPVEFGDPLFIVEKL